MKLYQIQYFCMVCQCQNNITQAANMLHISQPAVSSALKELEAEYSVKLFRRTGKHLVLTEEGKRCFEMASEILHYTENLDKTMSTLSVDHRTIHMGINTMQAAWLLPRFLSKFREAYPKIMLNVYELMTSDIIDALLNGHLDIGFVNLSTNSSKNASSLVEYIPLSWESHIVFCTYPGHPLARSKSVTLKQIAETPLVMLRATSWRDNGAQKYFDEQHLKPDVYLCVNSIDTAKAFVLAHQASIIISKDCTLNDPRLISIPLEDVGSRHIGLAIPKGRYINSDVSTLIDFVCNFTLGADHS